MPVVVTVSAAVIIGAGSWFTRVNAAVNDYEGHEDRVMKKLDKIDTRQDHIAEDVSEIKGWIEAQE